MTSPVGFAATCSLLDEEAIFRRAGSEAKSLCDLINPSAAVVETFREQTRRILDDKDMYDSGIFR